MVERLKFARGIAGTAYRLRITRAAIGILRSGEPISQAEFAEYAGLQRNTYNQFEQAKRLISVDAALKLHDAYGISLDWIHAADPSGLRTDLASLLRET